MLDKIVAHTRSKLVELKQSLPLAELERRAATRNPPSFRGALERDAINVIAEIKYRSPSRGLFPCSKPVEELTELYDDHGAVAISILTEEDFFDGSLEFLERAVKSRPKIPLLRKDFIVDPYQVHQAAAFGAAAYLLIVACLDQEELEPLLRAGQALSLEPLVEIHDPWELESALEAGAGIIGVNNRDLKTFEVRLETSFQIARRLEGESEVLLVAESGIQTHGQIQELRDAGFRAFLIGSSLMEREDPAPQLDLLLGKTQ